MKLLSVLCLVAVAVAVCSASKSYPVPVFVWSESDKFMPEGRTWHSHSVSTDEVREYLLKMSAPHIASDSKESLPLTESNPEVIVLFLEPGLFFGRSELLGGTRLSKDQSQLKKLKLMVEGAKSSVVVPYSYDDSMSKLSEEQRSYFLITKMHDTFEDFFASCEDCSAVVEPMDSTAKVAWTPFFFSDNRIVEASSLETYMDENSRLFHNGKTDLFVVHLPSSSSLSSYDTKISSVMTTLSKHTKEYVAVLSSDDMYLPTHSTDMYRESPEKLQWKDRVHARRDEPSDEMEDSDAESGGEWKYSNRWPAFVWEFLICWFMMVLIFSYGCCCLFGMDTPGRFDNPKEKCL